MDGQTLLSHEGTMQGDPFAMPFYALATVLLIRHLDVVEDLKEVWYADDASATCSLTSLCPWWDALASVGPGYGYFANASKTWLVMKERLTERGCGFIMCLPSAPSCRIIRRQISAADPVPRP